MNAHIREATLEDVATVASRLRDADLRELYANGHTDPHAVLRHGWAFSDPCYAMVGRDGSVFGLCGAVPDPDVEFRASVWMMATPGLDAEPIGVARGSRKLVKKWHKRFDLLYNWVDARNEVHVKWLRWLGFIFINKHFNDQGIPFYEFVKVKTDV